ncbi:toxin-antitoxin system YwqK family antitoxin [Marixanthomonas ophiurae]|uniref:Nicotinic acid mononucleotide adenyltransferase n=1 Tax=Marixanthomonas ophiurae TaxID=387659 RepID=A0A3E1QBK9_9FLAO|nr:nicotinic acid mononucleotide adenyltransferase [Marixanthomonas ophiurae]RFN59513.1 nicotinic acid mononucleotide adenyltransferase [Marixanthomonas ophiurae]
MKNIITLLALVAIVAIGTAQEKNNKDKYVLTGLDGNVVEATLYHDNGVVAQTGFYTLDNKLQGKWVSYDTNGNKTAIAEYDKGKKVGSWVFFQGETIKEVTYMNSKIAKVNTFKKDNTQIVSN